MKPLLALVLALPSLALANSPLDGTWVGVTSSLKLPDKPDVYVLSQGWFECKSCTPAYRIKADGTDQTVPGYAYYDTMAVQTVDAHTVKLTARKSGKVSLQETLSVSEKGDSLKDSFEDDTQAHPVTGSNLATRVAARPHGAHAISGSWRTTKVEDVSQNGMTTTVKTTDNGISVRFGNGGGYDAQFDGKDYPMIGDLGHTVVALKRLDPYTVEETDKQDGKPVAVVRVKVASDGKTADFQANDLRNGTTTRMKLIKQE
ncbi:MAG TPA: hypothetical protein VGL55_02980 [Steroidobacteraceae bacterium]|jgi:hypothetical protein